MKATRKGRFFLFRLFSIIYLRMIFFRIFAAANVERFDLIATTRKNAKTMLFPWVPEPAEGPFQLQTSHTNLLLTN